MNKHPLDKALNNFAAHKSNPYDNFKEIEDKLGYDMSKEGLPFMYFANADVY